MVKMDVSLHCPNAKHRFKMYLSLQKYRSFSVSYDMTGAVHKIEGSLHGMHKAPDRADIEGRSNVRGGAWDEQGKTRCCCIAHRFGKQVVRVVVGSSIDRANPLVIMLL